MKLPINLYSPIYPCLVMVWYIKQTLFSTAVVMQACDVILFHTCSTSSPTVIRNLCSHHCHHHYLPAWIRSFDLFDIDALPSFPRASTISSSSRFVVEGAFWGLVSFDPPISKAVHLCLWVLYFPWESYRPIRKTPILGGPVCSLNLSSLSYWIINCLISVQWFQENLHDRC